MHSSKLFCSRSLSEPTFLPIAGDKTSGTDSEQETASQRKVRFSRVAEVNNILLPKSAGFKSICDKLLNLQSYHFYSCFLVKISDAQVREMSASDALQANLARLSYAASLRAAAALQRAAERLTVAETAQLSLTFTFLFFLGNYSYQAALSHTEAGVVNVLSASSCLFTLILAAIFPSTPTDRISLTKLVAVLFTISGVLLVSYSDLKLEDGLPLGSLWTVAGALFYSSYIVFLRRKIDHEDKLDVPMFFGFVGLFCFAFLWPVFLLLHFTGHETFELPNRVQLLAMLVNGVVGTVLSELLWLLGCFHTSSLIATISISLTIPLTTFADVLVKKVSYDRLFYIGSIPMFVSFFIVALLSHWDNWDPMLECLHSMIGRARRCLCGVRRPHRRREVIAESLEQEQLIGESSGEGA